MKRLRMGTVVALLGAVLACEPGARKPDPAAVPQSSTVAVLGGRVVSLDEDHGAVVFMDLSGGNRVSVPVGRGPAQLTRRGDLVAVTLRQDRSVALVDAREHRLLRTATVGVEPHGIVFVDDRTVAVAVSGEDKVVLVDVQDGRVTRTFSTGVEGPHAMALHPDNKLYVSHLLRGIITVIDLRTGFSSGIPVNLAAGGFQLNASLVSSLTVAPDGSEVTTGNVNLNNENGVGNAPVDMGGGGGGYLGGPGSLPAVNPTLTTVDTRTDVMIHTQPQDTGGGESSGAPIAPVSDCPNCGQPGFQGFLPEAMLSNTGAFQLNEPVAVAYVDGGRGIAVLARGSRNLFVWRRNGDGTRGALVQVSRVGHGADGLAATEDGRNLVVHNAFDLSVSVVPLAPLEPGKEGAPPVAVETRDVASVDEQTGKTLAFADVDLPANVASGRRLFFDASLPSMTTGSGITCGTCHALGRNDNRTWQFIDGPRNTPTLAGAAEGRVGIATTTEPLHWRGELTTHKDLQRTITEFMGGAGLTPEQLDDVAAFMDTIPSPDVPLPTSDAELAMVVRGEELFHDTTVGCATCHSGEHKTDNLNHDVGTNDGLHADFQTAVLHGLRYTAPYGHDGRFATLEELLNGLVSTNLMGKGDHLTQDDLRALAAYMRTL